MPGPLLQPNTPRLIIYHSTARQAIKQRGQAKKVVIEITTPKMQRISQQTRSITRDSKTRSSLRSSRQLHIQRSVSRSAADDATAVRAADAAAPPSTRLPTAALAAAVCALCLGSAPLEAAQRTRQPPPGTEQGRCEVSALDKFADTRATFSQEASGGNMAEAVVDIRGCDYSGKDLSGKVGWGGGMEGGWSM
jgi:hypothetical protein